MQIAIFGASGFLGKQLSAAIIEQTDWDVVAIARRADKLVEPTGAGQRYRGVQADVNDYEAVLQILREADVAYYFVHMMGHKHVDFYDAELRAAQTFSRAATAASLPRLIFMGGLGDNDASQSKHLASRHRTGEILRKSNGIVIEFRASMIIGSGSVAYDIIQNVVRRLPVMVLPRSANTLTQPIAKADAVAYLLAAATVDTKQNEVIDIGGPKVLSYADIYKGYATFVHRKPLIIKLPFVPNFLSSLFLNALTPKIHARIGRAMVDSMTSEMVVTSKRAQQLFPTIHPRSIMQAFEEADAT